MAFGQGRGPAASRQQLAQLTDLVTAAGYDSFREARHPLGLSQRQANGQFTHDEASELIERLEDADDGGPPPAEASPPATPRRAPTPKSAAPRTTATRTAKGGAPDPQFAVLAASPDELLAEELVRRGWTCTPPT